MVENDSNLIAPKDLTGYLIGKSSGTSKTSFGDSDTAVNNIALFHWLILHTDLLVAIRWLPRLVSHPPSWQLL